ncbi:hypothetical protein TRIATDRAFT_316106 [Trichoderma atroviride IMI 206040]|uniref:U3 snoRNA associated n=1 Tax=Hypocrea atroviridis (strain ATCC 20476 / IMI 206040) TaxID=452589 RepID=G9NM34_HYPAI|nr:uncharacterized protein TRIATDRAFT_316106 [Trichoderma atroviride IMI 206040]EHK47966.1 hypothetical protein TRIATDRAFT_316106 [Trichoderma atroviride IMI 206040]
MPVQTRRRAAMQDTPVKGGASVTKKSSAKSSPAQKLPVREKEEEGASTPTKGTLKVFDDEDEDEANAPLGSSLNRAAETAEAVEGQEEEEEVDSDDEAPEAVSTTKVAEEIKKSAQVAQQAAKEQAATQKRKRQLRDELLKKQAEERKKADEAKEEVSATKSQSRKSEASSGRKRVQKSDIPAVLPAEFLEDSSSEDEDEDAADAASGPKRRKVSGVEKRLTRLDAGPKDEVVNSTVYRVAKKTDERMAPKLKKHTRSSKDLLLKRNRPAAKSGTGFFKK